MRKNLQTARKAAGLTQQEMADRIFVTLRHYKYIEAGKVNGSINLWDRMEDIFNVHQRVLRENYPDTEDSR